jgi:hypothetical protein
VTLWSHRVMTLGLQQWGVMSEATETFRHDAEAGTEER